MQTVVIESFPHRRLILTGVLRRITDYCRSPDSHVATELCLRFTPVYENSSYGILSSLRAFQWRVPRSTTLFSNSHYCSDSLTKYCSLTNLKLSITLLAYLSHRPSLLSSFQTYRRRTWSQTNLISFYLDSLRISSILLIIDFNYVFRDAWVCSKFSLIPPNFCYFDSHGVHFSRPAWPQSWILPLLHLTDI